MACSRLNSATRKSTIALSKLSPPRWLSPAVDLTSNTPSPISSTDVERAAAEVEDEDRLVGLLVEAVRERGRGRLVDDALDVQARDPAGVLRRLALVVVEVRRDGDDRGIDGLAQVRLGIRLELLQQHRGDLLRRIQPPVRFHPDVAARAGHDVVRDDRLLIAHVGLLAAHEALDGKYGVRRVGARLALGERSDEA